jgi:hypothetical protein
MKNYTVVYDPIETEKIPAELQPQMDELYHKVQKGNPSVKKKLDKLIRRYPNVASLWNYRAVWYESTGSLEGAKRVNDELIERFPNYFFAIVNKAVFEILAGNFEEGYRLLGNGELDISTLFPERKVFHITEFSAYTRAAIHYLAATGRFDEVETYIEKLKQEGFGGNFILGLKNLAYRYRLERMTQSWQASQESAVPAIERTTPTIAQVDALLEPQNVNYSYLYDADLWEPDTRLLEKDLQEDLHSLVTELHYILHRATEVMEYTFQEDEWTPAVLHAALLLAYLDTQNGFEKLLDLFRQPAELGEIYTGDWELDVLSAYFAHPFEGLLDTVKRFVLEPLVPVTHKNVMLEALEVMVEADASYQPKISELLEELMVILREQKDNHELMDSTLMAFVVGAAIDIKAVTLLPLIGELYAGGMVSEMIEGDFEEVKNAMQKDKIFKPYKIYTNPVEHIKSLNKSRKNGDFSGGGTDIPEENFEDDWYDKEAYTGLPTSHPVANNYSGTSLNAPCPCGSGKKYKRCHGKQ